MNDAQGPGFGMEAVFTELVERYQTALLRTCQMLLRDRTLAEDAVQETFLKVYRALPSFRGECGEKTWLMRIAVNTCRDMSKASWMRHHDRRFTPEDLPERAAPEREELPELAVSIRALPPRLREPLLLYYYQDMTLEETAQALGISRSAVSRRLKAARGKLRDALEKEGEP